MTPPRSFVWSFTEPVTVQFRQRGRRSTVQVDPAHAAVKPSADSSSDRQAGWRTLGKLTALPGGRLFQLELGLGDERRVAAWQRLERLVASEALASASPVLTDQDSGLRQLAGDEISVRFKTRCEPGQLATLMHQSHLALVRRNEFVATQFIFRVERAFGLRVLEVSDLLDALPEVEFAVPNFVTEVAR